jgi:CRISPR-associated protein Cas5h
MQSELTEHGSAAERSEQHPPDRCLSLTISGPWGHFRRVDGNVVKATYRLPPRTTVAGLLAAIAGYERNGYYDVFDREYSGIAIQPVDPDGEPGETAPVPRTVNLPENSLTTSNEGMKSVNSRGKVSVRYPDPNVDRQRTNYEVLVDPAYRIDVWTDDDKAYDRLHDRLADGRSEYVPSLGLSEFLASVRFHGEHTPEALSENPEPIKVESALPSPDSIVPSVDHSHGTERSPADMTVTERSGEFTGRKTTEFLRWAYSSDGNPLQAKMVEAYRVDGRTVVFS